MRCFRNGAAAKILFMTPESAVSLALNIQQTSDLTATKSNDGPTRLQAELKTSAPPRGPAFRALRAPRLPHTHCLVKM
jgi:hypothetical protein